jgi:type III secretion protein Q
VITTFDLSAAELRTLSLGDIVSLGASSRVRAGGQLRCESTESRLRILVRVEGGAFKVEAIESGRPQVIHSLPEAIRSVSMPPNPDDQAAREADVDALPVTLSFEAGELVLTVGELKGLAPGAMLSLGRRLTDSPITVRANGKVLATGELVLIDDFLGVRITGLRSHGAE